MSKLVLPIPVSEILVTTIADVPDFREGPAGFSLSDTVAVRPVEIASELSGKDSDRRQKVTGLKSESVTGIIPES